MGRIDLNKEGKLIGRTLETILVVFFILAMCSIFGKAFGYTEEVHSNGNSVEIKGTLTGEERTANQMYFSQRVQTAKDIYAGEIARQHETRLEIAKYMNALALQEAGADKTYVTLNNQSSSFASLENSNTNQLSNSNAISVSASNTQTNN
jgi:hypothetical protein